MTQLVPKSWCSDCKCFVTSLLLISVTLLQQNNDMCTYFSEALVFLFASSLLYLPPSALLGLLHPTVSLSQQCKGVDPSLILETNQLLGQCVKHLF